MFVPAYLIIISVTKQNNKQPFFTKHFDQGDERQLAFPAHLYSIYMNITLLNSNACEYITDKGQ